MNFAKVDIVTNFPNIYAFMDVIQDAMQTKEYSAVLKIVLNRFQRINSIYSYEFGNRVLQEFAIQLQELVQSVGDVYRMDGSKFSVCLRNVDETQIELLYKQIQRLVHGGLTVDSISVALTVSGGVVMLDDFTGDGQDVLAAATQALSESKQERHGDLVFFDYNSEEVMREKLMIMNAIIKSVYEGCAGFYILYQPIIKPATGEISGAEALIRWYHDEYGEVSPMEFIPWIEDNPCFLNLGDWTLRKAMEDCKGILHLYPDFMLSINVAYSQIQREEFRKIFVNLLRETGFPAKNICLELTERCYNVDLDFLKEEAAFYKSLGVKLVLDDFGTEYSSLKLLCELPIDRLKIDGSFVQGIADNPVKQIMVNTIAQCAHQLGLLVCLEGVENEEIRQFVKRYNVERHQGFYYSKAVSLETLLELLRQNPAYEIL